MSDLKIAHAFQQMIIANPTRSANSMISALKSTTLSIRRQDALTMISDLKTSQKSITGLMENIKDSNMSPVVRDKLHVEARKTARKSSVLTSQKKSTLKSRQKTAEGKVAGTVEDLENRLFNRIRGDRADYTEFYG